MLSRIDRQIVASWYRYLIEPRLAEIVGRVLRTTGPRIAVVGNCQSFGVACAMKSFDPTATVDQFSVIGRTRADMALLARTLSTYDYVFSHDFPEGHVRGGDSAALRERLDDITFFPAVGFAAFHPDLVYVFDGTRGQAVMGPLGPYHSALALFAFRRGLTLAQAQALFARNVYEAVGYLDLWDAAAKELVDTTKRRFDMDIGGDLMRWTRRGVFMYSIVHPRPFVLVDIAKQSFARVGLTVPDFDIDYYAADDLSRGEIFPVYPEIGEMYGFSGSYTFKLENRRAAGVDSFLTLPQYLSACYKVYQRCECAQPRVDAWLADAATSETLVALAHENLRDGRTVKN